MNENIQPTKHGYHCALERWGRECPDEGPPECTCVLEVAAATPERVCGRLDCKNGQVYFQKGITVGYEDCPDCQGTGKLPNRREREERRTQYLHSISTPWRRKAGRRDPQAKVLIPTALDPALPNDAYSTPASVGEIAERLDQAAMEWLQSWFPPNSARHRVAIAKDLVVRFTAVITEARAPLQKLIEHRDRIITRQGGDMADLTTRLEKHDAEITEARAIQSKRHDELFKHLANGSRVMEAAKDAEIAQLREALDHAAKAKAVLEAQPAPFGMAIPVASAIEMLRVAAALNPEGE